nr:calcitonin receptor [Parasteatoda tepidariorum]
MNPELSFYNCSRSTKLLLFLLLSGIEILMCEGESNISLTIEEENQNVACRTERRSYLPYDQYKIDTCARCYHYMPHNSFKNKFRYRWQLLGLLKDTVTNKSFEADPFNASTAILESFSEESFIYKWRGCCVAAMECCERMVSMPTLVSDSTYCPRTWDGWQCWDDTPGGTTAVNVCAGHIYFLNEPPSCPKYAYKVCWPNGTWYENYNRREWTNYTKCGRTDEHRRQLYFHVATYSISVISMVPALIIFSVYKQLQVHRISMHKNLFVSFFFKGLAVVLFKFFVVIDEFNRSPTYVTIMAYNSIACRILLIFTKYFKMTNYMWMFCEGYYLHKLIAAAFAEQKNLIMFYIIGWVFPLIPVCIYAVLRITQANEKCWAYPIESYEWIMNGPNMLSLMVSSCLKIILTTIINGRK